MSKRGAVFQRVAGLKPRRNVFDLSFRVNTTTDMGKLIPVGIIEAVPGDTFDIKTEVVVRFQPLVTPLLHEISSSVHYFFVPHRIAWRPATKDDDGKYPQDSQMPFKATPTFNWESFIRQNDYAEEELTVPAYLYGEDFGQQTRGVYARKGQLWDYFGFSVIGGGMPDPNADVPQRPGKKYRDIIMFPTIFPWTAYNITWNEYYRDQDIQSTPVNVLQYQVLNRSWKKDYFTSARPFRQKGPPAALPVNLYTIDEEQGIINNFATLSARTAAGDFLPIGTSLASAPSGSTPASLNINNSSGNDQNLTGAVGISSSTTTGDTTPRSGVATFDTGDLRYAFQLTKYEERRARAGTRYTELIRAHFGEAPSDGRLDRPEYMGGVKFPVVISEVLQTSETNLASNTMLGQMGGHAITADRSRSCRYHVQEFGTIIALFSCMPKPSYQDGIHRSWGARRTPVDYFWPEFSLLSEQAIYQGELFFHGSRLVAPLPEPLETDDFTVFGYCGQYDELRVMPDLATSEMRSLSGTQANVVPADNYDKLLSYWNLTRKFGWNQYETGFLGEPFLNSEFITCIPRKDVFLVPSRPGLIVNVNHKIRATRPLPLIAEPSLVDHN